MNIAELFYPSELKTIMQKLREKDQLRRNALKPLDKHILKKIYILCGINLIFLLFLLHPDISWPHVILIIACPPLTFYLLKYSLNKQANNVLWLYNAGIITQGYCTHFSRGYYKNRFTVKAQFQNQDTEKHFELRGGGYPPFGKEYKKGDTVFIAYNQENPDESVPLVKFLEDIYYLKNKSPKQSAIEDITLATSIS